MADNDGKNKKRTRKSGTNDRVIYLSERDIIISNSKRKKSSTQSGEDVSICDDVANKGRKEGSSSTARHSKGRKSAQAEPKQRTYDKSSKRRKVSETAKSKKSQGYQAKGTVRGKKSQMYQADDVTRGKKSQVYQVDDVTRGRKSKMYQVDDVARVRKSQTHQEQRIPNSKRKPKHSSEIVQGGQSVKRSSGSVKKRPKARESKSNGNIAILWRLPILLSFNRDAKGEKRLYKKTSRRGNNGGATVVIAFIAALVVIYIIGYSINARKTNPVAYETIQLGSVDSAKKADGVIIRSEKVFTAPSSGAVEYSVQDGEKIRSGDAVCSISNAQTVAKLEEDLESVNEDILKLQQNREDISENTEEVEKLNTQIQTLVNENTFAFASGDFSDVYNLKYSVENKLNSRNQLLLSENSDSLSELASKRSDGLKQIDENTTKVTSDVGGIVCYSIDGEESTFTTDTMATLTEEQMNTEATVEGIRSNVAANDPLFKVITSNEWYIAAYMPDSYTEGWEIGNEMTLYLQNGVEEDRSIDVMLNTLNHGQDTAYVIFKTNEYILDYMDARSISFEIDKPKTGFKIPDTAISQQTLLKIPSSYVDTDSSTVVKVTDSGEKTLEITISGTDSDESGDYVLVPVQMGYLSAGDTLKGSDGSTYTAAEVVTVDGVFIANSGVTEFAKINLENSVSSGGYTVLDETLNPNIDIYDRVVQNVINVQENQNIYG